MYEAALCGRESTCDRKYRYNLAVKRTLEQIVRRYPGDRDTADFRALTPYLKRVWFANGMHHHYGHDTLVPGFSAAAFARYVHATPAEFPLRAGQSQNGEETVDVALEYPEDFSAQVLEYADRYAFLPTRN